MPSEKTPEDLYDTLASYDLRADDVGAIRRWSEKRVRRFLRDLTENMPEPLSPPRSPFNFVASGQLSGLPTPCLGLDCRLKGVDALSRFAALYADHVVVRPRISDLESAHRRVASTDSREERRHRLVDLKRGLSNDIRVLFELKPLVVARIVSLSESARHICQNCIRKTVETGSLPKADRSALSQWDETTGEMIKFIDQEFLREAEFWVLRDQLGHVIKIRAPERLLEHGTLRLRRKRELPAEISKKVTDHGYRLSADEVRDLHLTHSFTQEVVEDINAQHFVASGARYSYITRRPLDIDLLRKYERKEPRIDAAAADALSHPLSYLDNVAVEELIEVRQREGESFQLYREAITKLIRNLDRTSPGQAREALDDLVRPEVAKIEATLNRRRGALAKSITQEAVVSAGMISIGTYSGLLPEVWQAVAAVTGGALGLKSIVTTAIQAMRQPDSLAENDFYFLWKLKRAAKS